MKVKTVISVLQQNEPELKDPDGLTENILSAIAKDNSAEVTGKVHNLIKTPVLLLVRRVLAAASVCIFLSFSYEQYIVMKKISVLEKQNTAISRSEPYKSALRLKQALKIIEGDPAILTEYRDLQKTGILNAHYLLKNIQDQFSYPKNNTGK